MFGFAKSSGSHSSHTLRLHNAALTVWCCHPRVRLNLCGKVFEPPDRCRMTIAPPYSFHQYFSALIVKFSLLPLSVRPFVAFCCPYNKDSWALSQMFSLARVLVLQTFVSAAAACRNVLVKLLALRFGARRFSAGRYSWSSSDPLGHWLLTCDARCAKHFINFAVELKTFISLLFHRYDVF